MKNENYNPKKNYLKSVYHAISNLLNPNNGLLDKTTTTGIEKIIEVYEPSSSYRKYIGPYTGNISGALAWREEKLPKKKQ